MNSSLQHHVALVQCGGYLQPELSDSINTIFSALPLPLTLRGATVLLKPNLISSRGPSLACTNALFLAAVARWCSDHGARVKIGDSPAFGTTISVMERHGMTQALRGVVYNHVHFKTPVPRKLYNGLTLEIAGEALDCDLLINLPKLKAHNQMYMTAAVKNIFGIVVGIRKAMLHMRHGGSHLEFADMLLGLPELLPPHISVVDGVEIMHRSGPLDGDPLSLGVIGGALSPVALDTALLNLLELPFHQSPLWQAAAARNFPGSSHSDLIYPLAVPSAFHGSGFIPPERLNAVRFNPIRFLVSALRRFKLAIRQ
jgi:uncharacterized protein (DUF362 family)